LDTIEPVGLRVLICKDEERRTTKGGIHLPDDAKIPVITGRIVAISQQVDNDPDYPLKQYDKVIVNPSNAIPVDFERDNKLFVIPVEDVVAVMRPGAAEGEE
jgi:chaperonin GroES